MLTRIALFALIVAFAPSAWAGPQSGRVLEVLDGGKLKVDAVDENGKDRGDPATFGIRGVAVPTLDQPFGKQALAWLKQMVEGKKVVWNGPIPRANKAGHALHFRTEDGKSLAVQMLSEGLGRVVVSELEFKPAKPDEAKKASPEETAAIAAEREAREAKRGLWAEQVAGSPKEIKNSVGMKLVYIPPGKFTMGSPESEVGREAQEVLHEVELTKGFYMSAHEVTVGQFKQFVADTKYQTDGERDGKGAYGANEAGQIEAMHARFTWKTPGFEQTDDHPVVDVSWSDAKAFCNWLSEKEKKTYRLPTEAEWEYACRAGTKTAYVHGDDPEDLTTTGNGADATARAKFPGWSIGIQAKDSYVFTAPVGQFKANAFRLHDMHGNVWEWCEDWYEPNRYPNGKQVDPTGPATGQAKVQRGGGWSSDFKRLRSAARVGRDSVAYRGCYQGFRVALVPASAEAPKESGTAAEKHAGRRVAYMLLVNGAVTDAVVNSANIEGHKSVEAPYIGTWHSFLKGMESIQKGRLDPVEQGKIDVMLIGTLNCYPNAEAWKNHLGLEDSTLAGFVALGVKNNPKFRIVWQTFLWPSGKAPKYGKKTLDVADTKKRHANDSLKELEALVDAINQKHGRQVVLISPVAEATMKLVEMVAEGKFPSLTDPADLWTEFNMHSNRHVLALTAYCNVATMYGISPVGLKPDFSKVTYGGGGKGPGTQSMDGITDEQQAILQNIAWESVSKYRHAGVAK